MREVGYTIVALVVFAGIIFGGWEAGWWFRTANTNRADVLYTQSHAAQNAAKHELSQQITELANVDSQIANPATAGDQRTGLTAQRMAILNQACETAGSITHPTPTHEAWRTQNCGVN